MNHYYNADGMLMMSSGQDERCTDAEYELCMLATDAAGLGVCRGRRKAPHGDSSGTRHISSMWGMRVSVWLHSCFFFVMESLKEETSLKIFDLLPGRISEIED